MDTKDIIDESSDNEEQDIVEKLETAMDAMNYISRVQKRLDKLNSKILV